MLSVVSDKDLPLFRQTKVLSKPKKDGNQTKHVGKNCPRFKLYFKVISGKLRIEDKFPLPPIANPKALILIPKLSSVLLVGMMASPSPWPIVASPQEYEIHPDGGLP